MHRKAREQQERDAKAAAERAQQEEASRVESTVLTSLREGPGGRCQEECKKPSLPSDSDDEDNDDTESQIFDFRKFNVARTGFGPVSGSNLRAWRLAAAAGADADSGSESGDDEIDWVQQQRERRGAHGLGGRPTQLPTVALPSMRSVQHGKNLSSGRGSSSDSSGSDVEPIFIRR